MALHVGSKHGTCTNHTSRRSQKFIYCLLYNYEAYYFPKDSAKCHLWMFYRKLFHSSATHMGPIPNTQFSISVQGVGQ